MKILFLLIVFIVGRYPGEEGLLPIGDPEEKDAKKAVSIAQNILDKIRNYFSGEAI